MQKEYAKFFVGTDNKKVYIAKAIHNDTTGDKTRVICIKDGNVSRVDVAHIASLPLTRLTPNSTMIFKEMFENLP